MITFIVIGTLVVLGLVWVGRRQRRHPGTMGADEAGKDKGFGY
jgi:hypothetical protein